MSPPPLLLPGDGRTTVRVAIGALLAGADTAAVAVARVRLGTLDLRPVELAKVQRCRVLLGQFDATALSGVISAHSLQALLAFCESGRLDIRAAPGVRWTPDFSVYRGRGSHGTLWSACIVGAHYFGEPAPSLGAPLSCVVADESVAAAAEQRFDRLWRRAHDVTPAIRDALDALLAIAEKRPHALEAR